MRASAPRRGRGQEPDIIPLSPPNNKKGSFFGPFLLFDRTWVRNLGIKMAGSTKLSGTILNAR